MRNAAEKAVNEARKIYERYVSASQRSYNALQDLISVGWAATREIALRMVTMSNANAKAGFDYAEMLARVQTLSEVQALQHTFLQQQAERLHEQMSEIGEISRRFAKEFSELVKLR